MNKSNKYDLITLSENKALSTHTSNKTIKAKQIEKNHPQTIQTGLNYLVNYLSAWQRVTVTNIHTLYECESKNIRQYDVHKIAKKLRKYGTTATILVSTVSLIGCSNSTTPNITTNTFCNFHLKPFFHTVCSVPQTPLLAKDSPLELSLHWRQGNENTNKQVKPYHTFDNLINGLDDNKQSLNFAVNGGMYNQEYAPIGYTIIDKQQVLSLNLNEGAGNFHLMPNGVFWADDNGFYVTESHTLNNMLKKGSVPTFATQSGPMLVIDNNIHPEFKADSTSKKIRNGVGVCQDGSIKFVNSQIPVNFHEFASLYKNTLLCDNALFLDGGIASALYSEELSENDKKSMGVMIALIQNTEQN